MKQLLLILAALLACSSVGGGGDGFRVPVAEAQRVADMVKATFMVSDINQDGFVDNAEWALVANGVLAEVIRIYSTTQQ